MLDNAFRDRLRLLIVFHERFLRWSRVRSFVRSSRRHWNVRHLRHLGRFHGMLDNRFRHRCVLRGTCCVFAIGAAMIRHLRLRPRRSIRLAFLTFRAIASATPAAPAAATAFAFTAWPLLFAVLSRSQSCASLGGRLLIRRIRPWRTRLLAIPALLLLLRIAR
ncbi:MAG: hypothetical protein ABIS45_06430, partial [Burkholderiales bacterium]